jgi:hypothetical protein
LLLPTIVLVLGATTIPVELRRVESATLAWGLSPLDVVANLLLYLPVGLALASLGFWRAVVSASLLSLVAETCQFAMMHRFPSPSDLAMNVAGAAIGVLIARQWRVVLPAISVNVRTAWLSALAALAILGLKAWSDRHQFFVNRWKELPVNARGATLPGSLEAHWTFDQIAAGVFPDSYPDRIEGKAIGRPILTDGIHGKAVRLDGEKDYADFGHPIELCLMGSMTICAWFNPSSFAGGDAAIVSSFSPGFQLDTTFDRGRRTIGFKLVDPCGNIMARYGATELHRHTWYHGTGVYDSDSRVLHVYLNGHLDDGFLQGPVARAQKASHQPVYVGRRADAEGYGFAGLIDDVHIFSRALDRKEIESCLNGVEPGGPSARIAARARAGDVLEQRIAGQVDACHQSTRNQDALLPGMLVGVGVLSALACAGFWPRHEGAILVVSMAVGLLLLPVAVITLPPYVPWMIPLLSFAGGASVAASYVRASQSPASDPSR